MPRPIAETLIYLASPYSHPDAGVMEKRYQLILRVAADMMFEGMVVYSPIVHNHPIACVRTLPRDWGFWERHDRVILERSNFLFVVMFQGWEHSKGIAAEVELAKACEIPVHYLYPDKAEHQARTILLTYGIS